MKRFRKTGGYALLIVLIAVAILLILYAVQMRAFFVPDHVPSSPTGAEQRPWLMEELLAGENERLKRPTAPQPELTAPFQLAAPVTREAADRGTVVIDFGTDARVRGAWETTYTQDGQTYTITATMQGNIVAGRTYEDADGRDRSRLFFIACGTYLKQAAGPAGIADENGQAWLTGWVRADLSATGHITLTTDRRWSAVYDFATADAP